MDWKEITNSDFFEIIEDNAQNSQELFVSFGEDKDDAFGIIVWFSVNPYKCISYRSWGKKISGLIEETDFKMVVEKILNS